MFAPLITIMIPKIKLNTPRIIALAMAKFNISIESIAVISFSLDNFKVMALPFDAIKL